ncbi:MAG: ADP-ribosylglycohydrolase family protein [Caldilineaceae bacterium]
MTEDEILKRYGRNGKLTHLPTKHEARLEVLAWVAGPIRPGVAYRESEINDLLRGHDVDHVTLRRYLVDYGFLTRQGGIYQLAPNPPWPPAEKPLAEQQADQQTSAKAAARAADQDKSAIARSGRFRGCLIGLAIGDAVGTTVEFKPRGSFAPLKDMVGGGPFSLPPGAWTDDTSMALCLATSLVEKRGFDALDQMQRYLRWREEGYLSSIGRCFDIGTATNAALSRFKHSGDPYSGSDDPHSAGNGSIMRLAPVPMFFAGDPPAAVAYAVESSRTTHAAQECLDASRLFAAILLAALAGADKSAVLFGPHAGLAEGTGLGPKLQAIAEGAYRNKDAGQIHGSGYVVDSLEAALWSFWRTDNFRDAILTAVNLGDDADTTAAVCGQVAGAFYGESGIPGNWRKQLVMVQEIRALADQLQISQN